MTDNRDVYFSTHLLASFQAWGKGVSQLVFFGTRVFLNLFDVFRPRLWQESLHGHVIEFFCRKSRIWRHKIASQWQKCMLENDILKQKLLITFVWDILSARSIKNSITLTTFEWRSILGDLFSCFGHRHRVGFWRTRIKPDRTVFKYWLEQLSVTYKG